ncbi:preprotein translocase subunit SecE [Blattabacterium sp. (Cryptocercus kyebangensis)]|uniref:preprotein translocase subunit SecE n=1 Tax=Blattabacterium sp. (Cryptocercus kyebangensis) TaxID=298656 RepID=UPI000D7C9E4E|nr:preprotein translocase subunit SecE [Blattabacterium sp. (Cryptocercus kyebangensis)]AWU43620.1 preprotein translocase subunit SecE [Blattabacterium sp. (Cryptocercus kyebangensis)]
MVDNYEKKNYFLEIYDEFFYFITWPKWIDLQITTLIVSFFSIFLSMFLYGVDGIFIFFIKKLFSL